MCSGLVWCLCPKFSPTSNSSCSFWPLETWLWSLTLPVHLIYPLWLLLFTSLKLQLWGCFVGISFKYFFEVLYEILWLLGLFAKLQKNNDSLCHVCPSFHLSIHNLALTGWIFMKFHIFSDNCWENSNWTRLTGTLCENH